MADFSFRISPDVIIASYACSRLGQFASEAGSRFMLIMDPVLRAVGLADTITQSLKDRNLDYFVFDEFGETADSKTVDAALKLAKSAHIHGIIAAGGGKAVSVGRAVAALSQEKDGIYEFLDGSVPGKKALPLICLCTTCRDAYVFTDKVPLVDSRTTQVKLLKIHNGVCKATVFDPNFSVTLTENQIESMSLEALCLACEAYLSQRSSFFSDMLAEKAVELLSWAMDGSASHNVTTPQEELLAQGGCMASLASASSSIGAASLLALAINGRFKISRSLVSAILLPYIIEDCAKFKTEKVENLAKIFRIEPPENAASEVMCQAFADNIRQRMAKANLPTRLKDLSVSVDQLALAAEDCGKLEFINNLPRAMTSDDLFELIKAAY